MKGDSQPIARDMRQELEAHSIWSLPPTLILFTILVADRTLRARFEADVPGVLVEFGMKSPKHLVGLSERLCPVMPRIPTDVEVAEDIRHPFWEKWLDGAIPQLDNFGARAQLLPDREKISAEDWNWLITHAKRIIQEKSSAIELKEIKAKKPRRTRPAERSFHLINVSLPKCGSAWLTSLFGNFRAAHEFEHERTNTKILNWRNELISDEELVSFIRSRDGIRLDVDSCTSMHLIAGSLADWFPERPNSFIPTANSLNGPPLGSPCSIRSRLEPPLMAAKVCLLGGSDTRDFSSRAWISMISMISSTWRTFRASSNI